MVPNSAAPLFQITQNQSHSFSYHPLSSEMWKAASVMTSKPFANCMFTFYLPKFSVSTFLAFLFFWNSGRGKERRWRILLKFKTIWVGIYLFIPVDTVHGWYMPLWSVQLLSLATFSQDCHLPCVQHYFVGCWKCTPFFHRLIITLCLDYIQIKKKSKSLYLVLKCT